MKGISPIIAIIIILLITIAIAGAAYSYISVIWGRTSEGIQLVSTTCTAGTAKLTVRNIGTDALTATDITVTRTNPAGAGTIVKPAINPGATGDITDSACGAGNLCIYQVLVSGQSQPLMAQC